MSPLGIGSIVFVCVFGSAMLGCYLRTLLADHHLTDDSMRVVTMSTGLITTLAAMVLGLLISSAKTSFESINDEVTQTASKVVLLDRSLVNYGPEAKETRELLHRAIVSVTEMIFAEKGSSLVKLTVPERLAGMEQFRPSFEIFCHEMTPNARSSHARWHSATNWYRCAGWSSCMSGTRCCRHSWRYWFSGSPSYSSGSVCTRPTTPSSW